MSRAWIFYVYVFFQFLKMLYDSCRSQFHILCRRAWLYIFVTCVYLFVSATFALRIYSLPRLIKSTSSYIIHGLFLMLILWPLSRALQRLIGDCQLVWLSQTLMSKRISEIRMVTLNILWSNMKQLNYWLTSPTDTNKTLMTHRLLGGFRRLNGTWCSGFI